VSHRVNDPGSHLDSFRVLVVLSVLLTIKQTCRRANWPFTRSHTVSYVALCKTRWPAHRAHEPALKSTDTKSCADQGKDTTDDETDQTGTFSPGPANLCEVNLTSLLHMATTASALCA
jgi:hypothetical protein